MRFVRFLPVVFFCFALAGLPAAAQPADPRRAVQQGQALPLGAILQRTMPDFPGRLLKADLERDRGGRLIYRLRILQDSGQILIVTSDARTGSVLDVRGSR